MRRALARCAGRWCRRVDVGCDVAAVGFSERRPRRPTCPSRRARASRCGCRAPSPWKPAITATCPSPKRRTISEPSISWMRAEAWAPFGADRDLPALPGARVDAHLLQRDREETRRHLLAGGDHRVVIRARRAWRRPACTSDELVGLARHGRDDHGHLVAGVHLAFDVARDVPDPVDVGDGGGREFENETRHDFRPMSSGPPAVRSAGVPVHSGGNTSARFDAGPRSARRAASVSRTGGGAQGEAGTLSRLTPAAGRNMPGQRVFFGQRMSTMSEARQTTRSSPARSSASRSSPPNGGTRAASSSRCTSSTRCASPTSASRSASTSVATSIR